MSPFVIKTALFCKHVVYKVKKNKQVTTDRKFWWLYVIKKRRLIQDFLVTERVLI